MTISDIGNTDASIVGISDLQPKRWNLKLCLTNRINFNMHKLSENQKAGGLRYGYFCLYS